MEKELIQNFLDNFVKIVIKKPEFHGGRTTFNLYGIIKEVTDEGVVFYTDRLGVILLEDIISIQEANPKKPNRRDNYAHH